MDRNRSHRVGLGRLHATPRGARSPGDDRLGIFADPFELLDERLAALKAVHAVLVQRRVALDRDDVIAFVLRHDLGEDLFCLVTGRSHQRVVVVKRDQREYRVLGEWMRRADEGLRAARALVAVKPKNWRSRLRFERVRDLRGTGGGKTE